MSINLKKSRREFLQKLTAASAISAGAALPGWASDRNHFEASAIEEIKKIDIHTHISSDAAYLREVMDTLNLKMFTICNEGLKVDRLEAQVEAAISITKQHPRYYSWCTTFGFDGMYEPDWKDRVIGMLKNGFDNGALAVKVWKEIGMELKDPEGQLVQIDDPIFDPVLDYIAKEGKTLFAHIGDPVHQWLSVGPEGESNGWYEPGAGVWNRVGEFRGETAYHDLILARDRMLSTHSDLRVVGCHLGSMEFDVDLVAERLDRFTNFAVETSSVLGSLMDQSREKVKSFFMNYQDRILYGADISGGMVPTRYLVDMSKVGQQWSLEELKKEKADLLKRYRDDFAYYTTDREISRGDYSIQGLALPKEVLHKIFYSNAVKWVPGIDKSF